MRPVSAITRQSTCAAASSEAPRQQVDPPLAVGNGEGPIVRGAAVPDVQAQALVTAPDEVVAVRLAAPGDDQVLDRNRDPCPSRRPGHRGRWGPRRRFGSPVTSNAGCRANPARPYRRSALGSGRGADHRRAAVLGRTRASHRAAGARCREPAARPGPPATTGTTGSRAAVPAPTPTTRPSCSATKLPPGSVLARCLMRARAQAIRAASRSPMAKPNLLADIGQRGVRHLVGRRRRRSPARLPHGRDGSQSRQCWSCRQPDRCAVEGSSTQFRRTQTSSSRRPSKARPSVTSSAYSRSPPTGSPLASRVTRRPIGLTSRAR